jgi:protoporphyrinogen oxidase
VSGQRKKHVVIIGAGPAGLTAGLELSRTGKYKVTLIEKEKHVGGLSRTTEYKGYLFDIGPHHFITESKVVEHWWKGIMGDDFAQLKRFTRIYYKKKFFYYPLQPINALKGLNFYESVRCVISYLWAKIFPIKQVKSFQDFVTNRFGYRLFSIFFKTYSEKLWGISCKEISADWAAERIRSFSLGQAIFFAFFGKMFKKNTPRTIRDNFYYPSRGAGSLWARVSDCIKSIPENSVLCDNHVVTIEHKDNKITSVCTKKSSVFGGVAKLIKYSGDYFFSTMTLRDFVLALDPVAPEDVIASAKSLRCRALITVNLCVNKKDICPDHWLYMHEPGVKHIRIGNMNNFSISMVDSPEHTALSLEYFLFSSDSMWKMSDKELIELGKIELEQVGLARADQVLDGMVIKTSDAYPIYEGNYKEYLKTVLDYLGNFKNLQLIGRNGRHQYNNMDVAMLSAFDAVNYVKEGDRKEFLLKQKKDFTSQIQI